MSAIPHGATLNGVSTLRRLNDVQSQSVSLERCLTYPPVSSPKMYSHMKKRLVVCCDGTWQDGIVVDARWKYTNVLRLARAVAHVDDRTNPPIAQVVFYQSGIGSSNSLYDEVVDGATGATLGEKVEEAYAFIAQNYHPGDDIFLFGFSRGAYTARTVASFIGEIGVLDRLDMDHFAEIFVAFQKRGKATDPDEQRVLDAKLAPWTDHNSPGKKRADSGPHSFSIKCVGIFDTVGSVGLPEEITRHSERIKTLFGFRDNALGEHIERAYQALALNEMRADFDCAKYKQTEGGRLKQQVLKQCWFTGCHSDIGGGYHEHDLADLTLTWMAANVGDMLSLNVDYIASLPDPVAPWGEQPPDNSAVGIFSLAKTIQRKIPSATDEITHETIHPSVLKQQTLVPELAENIQRNPSLVCTLLPLEEELRRNWRVNGTQKSKDALAANSHAQMAKEKVETDEDSEDDKQHIPGGFADAVVSPGPKVASRHNWVAAAPEETSLAVLWREFI